MAHQLKDVIVQSTFTDEIIFIWHILTNDQMPICLFGQLWKNKITFVILILKSFLAIFNVSFQKLEFLSVPNFLLLRRTLEQKLYPWNKLCGGRPGLLVMRGEWQSRSREFESQQAPDSTRWIISSHSVVVKLDSVV